MALFAINALKTFGYFKNKIVIPVFGIDATPVAIKSLVAKNLQTQHKTMV